MGRFSSGTSQSGGSLPRSCAWALDATSAGVAHRPLDLGLSDLTTTRPCNMPCFFTVRGKVRSGGACGLLRENRFGSQQAILGLHDSSGPRTGCRPNAAAWGRAPLLGSNVPVEDPLRPLRGREVEEHDADNERDERGGQRLESEHPAQRGHGEHERHGDDGERP